MRTKRWTQNQLQNAVKISRSVRQVIEKLGLVPAGGNYVQIQKYLKLWKINTKHFTGMGWNKGLQFKPNPAVPIESILKKNSTYQSYKLKRRLFIEGFKKQKCEFCGWSKKSIDGRVPLELDHINGDRFDNRLNNLQILCPNCHSLQPTHRGLNRKK
jgi:hypothetical protein